MSNLRKAAYQALLAIALVLVSFFVGREVVLGGSEHDELGRVSSPSGDVDAVVIHDVGVGGAVADVHKELFLLPSSTEDFRGTNKVLDLNHLYDLDKLEMIWRGEGLLEVRYPPSTRITAFKNHVLLENEQGETYEVEVQLIPTATAVQGRRLHAPARLGFARVVAEAGEAREEG